MMQNQDHCPRYVGCIQFLVCQGTFSLTFPGKSPATMLVRVWCLYTIILIIPSPLPYHSCSSWLFFKIKADLCWEASGIYNLGVGYILINWKNQPSAPSSSLSCLFSGRKGTSARANNSILRLMGWLFEDTALFYFGTPEIALWHFYSCSLSIKCALKRITSSLATGGNWPSC